LTTPGRAGARNNASVHVAFRETEHVGTRDFQVYAAQWLAYALPCRPFADILADANARLGADADRYSFIVVDVHHLLLAGFYRRTGLLEFCSQPHGRLLTPSAVGDRRKPAPLLQTEGAQRTTIMKTIWVFPKNIFGG
jgi:hypothetical protein